MATTAKLGSFVRTKTYGHTGIVFGKHQNFRDTGHDDDWFACQQPPLADQLREAPWYSVLLRDSGSVLVPEDEVVVLDDPIAITNPWYDFYF